MEDDGDKEADEDDDDDDEENEEDTDIDDDVATPPLPPLLLLNFSGLRRQYSKSSTVHTAPLTFSTRMKHLCKLKLCLTAFLIKQKKYFRC